MSPFDLAERWRFTASLFREHEQPSLAIIYEKCADELDSALDTVEQEPLNLRQAAEFSGYSADHLGRLVRDGKIPNAGRPGAPRIARGDLPRKSGIVANAIPMRELDYKQIVRSAIEEGAA